MLWSSVMDILIVGMPHVTAAQYSTDEYTSYLIHMYL